MDKFVGDGCVVAYIAEPNGPAEGVTVHARSEKTDANTIPENWFVVVQKWRGVLEEELYETTLARLSASCYELLSSQKSARLFPRAGEAKS